MCLHCPLEDEEYFVIYGMSLCPILPPNPQPPPPPLLGQSLSATQSPCFVHATTHTRLNVQIQREQYTDGILLKSVT